MSSMAVSPGNRPLEQLKVAELRDELRKRGMSAKGVKKDLLERLEEAVKKEEQEGIGHGEHEAQEGAHNRGTLDDTEDVEGEEEIPERTKHEASQSDGTTTACPSNTLPDIPIPSTEELPFSEGTHSLPGVSALDKVPGSNEVMEKLCTADGANVETHNDVLFVDEAVCGKGNSVLLPENTANVAEACKDISGVEHVECENDEKEPGILISELEDSKRGDAIPESRFASSVIGNVVSDILDVTVENGDRFVAVNSAVIASEASGNDCSMHDVESTNLKVDQLSIPDTCIGKPSLGTDDASRNDRSVHDVENTNLTVDQLSIPDTSIEKNSSEADKSVMEPLIQPLDSGEPVGISQEEEVCVLNTESSIVSSSQSIATREVYAPSAGLKSEGLERANVDERGLITNEDKSDVTLEQVVKHEIISEGEPAVNMELMEIETGLEERHEVICDIKMELQTDKEDHTQLGNPPEELQLKEVRSAHEYSRRNRGEESASRVPNDWKKDKDDDFNVKPVEDVTQARINLKRKDNVPEADVKQQEPAKRMRRWNSGKEVVVDTLKPLTTDSMKEIMLPDHGEGSSAAAQRLTPKAVATSRALPPSVKVEPEPSNNARMVPPSTRAPSNSLKVERFVRPFTLKAAKELLAEFGQCVNFWMDQIKTHCFVTYSSVNEAVAARNGLYGRQWPPSVGNCLVAEFVDVNEVKIRSDDGLAENAQAKPTAALMRVSNSTQPPPPRVVQSASSIRNDSNTLLHPRFSRERQLSPILKKDPEPAAVTLEDLFCKTKAKPHIYYLPLTDEQVAEKIKNKQAVR